MIYSQRLPSEFMLCFTRLLMTNSAARKEVAVVFVLWDLTFKETRKFQCFYLASYKIWSVYGPNYLILYCKSVLEEILTDLHLSIEGVHDFRVFFLSSSGVSDGGRSLKVEEAVQRPPKVPPTLPTKAPGPIEQPWPPVNVGAAAAAVFPLFSVALTAAITRRSPTGYERILPFRWWSQHCRCQGTMSWTACSQSWW